MRQMTVQLDTDTGTLYVTACTLEGEVQWTITQHEGYFFAKEYMKMGRYQLISPPSDLFSVLRAIDTRIREIGQRDPLGEEVEL